MLKITGTLAVDMYPPAFLLTSREDMQHYYQLLIAYTIGYLSGQDYVGDLRTMAVERVRKNLETWNQLTTPVKGNETLAIYLSFEEN